MDNKTKEFLQRVKDSGNWNDNLDYSKGIYKGSREPFELWCKIHEVDVSKKQARELFSKKGCKFCGHEESKKKRNHLSGLQA